MRNLNIGGSWEEEFYKIASEKGWIVKEAAEPEPATAQEEGLEFEPTVINVPRAGKTIWDLQQILQVTVPTMPLSKEGGPDGKWGPLTARAWNALASQINAKKGDLVLTDVNPDGSELPILDQMRWVIAGMPSGTDEDIVKELQGAEDAAPESRVDDNMKTTAFIIQELISLASDLEEMGEVEAAVTIDKQISIYKEALDKLYDVTGETGEQLIEQAHPGGGPTIVPAKEEGGKVETVVEEQKKSIDKATKKPTGKYAQLVLDLIATANSLEDEGRTEEAQMVDQTLRELLETPPFVNRSAASETAGSEDSKVSDLEKTAFIRENVSADIKDFVSELKQAKRYIGSRQYWPAIDGVINKLTPHIAIFEKVEGLDFTKRANLERAKKAAKLLHKTLLQVFGPVNTFAESAMTLSTFKAMALRKKFHDIFASLKELLSGASYAVKKFGPKEAPKPAPAAIGQPESQILRNYRSALRRVLKIMENPDHKLLNILGKGNRKTGRRKAFEIENKIKTELENWYNKIQAGDRLDTLYNKIIKPLQTHGIIVASAKDELIKEADLGISIAPKGKPSKKKPTKGKAVKLDPLVKKFQQAAMALYGPGAVGPKKDDGKWGPKTKAAYEKVMSELRKIKPDAKVFPAQPTPQSLNWGIYIAERLAQMKGAALGLPQDMDIPYTDKISFKLRELANPRAFLTTLAGFRAQNIMPDVHTGEETAEAFTILAKLYNKLTRDKEYREDLTFRSGVVGVADKIAKVVFETFNQLYRMPGGKKSYEGLIKKKTPAKETPKKTPKVRMDLSWASPGRERAEELDTPEKVYVAIRGLPFVEFLAQVNAFEEIALNASRYDKSLRGFWGETVPYGSETSRQRREVAMKFLEKLKTRAGRLYSALGRVQGEFLAKYKRKDFLNLVHHMQTYFVALRQLAEAL